MKIGKIALFLLLLATTTSCFRKLDEQIVIEGIRVANISTWPTVTLDIDVENSSRYKVQITSAELTLKEANRQVAVATLVEPISAAAGATSTISSHWTLTTPSLFGGMALMGRLLKDGGLESLTVDYEVVGKAAGFSKRYSEQGIPMNKLFNNN